MSPIWWHCTISLNYTKFYDFVLVARFIYYAVSNDLDYMSGAKKYSEEMESKILDILKGYYEGGYLNGKKAKLYGVDVVVYFQSSRKGEVFFKKKLDEARKNDRYAPVIERLNEIN